MADSRHSSTLDIKINARALDDLKRKLGQVFSRQGPREFNSAVEQVNRSLETNVQRTQAIVREMAKVEAGSKAYKKLASELREANKEGRSLVGTLQRVDQASRASARAASGGFGGGGGAAGGGAGGGMLGRMGGMQLPMPGLGAAATMMSAIPVAGVLGAGAMMAAAGTYQSHLRYQRARLDAAPFLMSARDALSYSPSMRQVPITQTVPQGQVAGRIVREVGTGQAAAVGPAGLTTAELGSGWRADRRRALEQRFGQGFGGAYASLLETPLVTGIEEVTGLGAVGRRVFEDMQQTRQKTLRDLQAPTLAEVIGTPEQAAQARADRERMISGLEGREYSELGLRRQREAETNKAETRTVIDAAFEEQAMRQASVRMGFDPATGLQMAGQLAQGAGRPIGATELEQAMALQRMTGIGVGQTGEALRRMRYAGELGGTGGGDMQGVANLIGTAVSLGLEGSEISDYLREQTGFLNQMANQGIGIDVEKMRALEGTIAQSGIAARWRADDIGRAFIGGAARTGREGPQSAEQFRLMRAFGFTGEGGMEEFFKARMAMQSPAMAEQLGMSSPAEALSRFVEEMRVEGAGEFMQAGIIQKSFGNLGVQLGPEEAMQFARGISAAEAEGTQFQIDTEAASRLVGAMGGSVRAEAGIEAERIGVGGTVAGTMQDLSRTVNDLAGTFQNVFGQAMGVAAGQLENFTGALERATQGMDAMGFYDPLGVSRTQP